MQYTAESLHRIDQMENFSDEEIFNMQVVSKVLPFKTNNYVVEYLIDWNNAPNDPMFVLTFPQKNMLIKKHFDIIADLVRSGAKKQELDNAANKIRLELNPHPAGQMELNVPTLKDGTKLYGMQHKYKETCLFFPSQSQTCHAYCSFCFRWPQFVGMDDMKFASKEANSLVQYLLEHPEITDVLFTGGDPMIMKGEMFRTYVDELLDANLPNLKTIRIGTKMLSYWPYKVLTDTDADVTLETFESITKNGIHLSVMAHFNHYVEIQTQSTRKAIKKIRATGAQIRTQSPLLAHINDDASVWKKMWTDQVNLGCIPYYMFMVRDTGAQHYFGVPLVKSYHIFKEAYSQVSGLARTVRGPSMSATPGKIQIDGIVEVNGQKAMSMKFLQARNPDWACRTFLAKYDENAVWLDDLKPAFGGEKFFFENDPASATLRRN